MIFPSISEVKKGCAGILEIRGNDVMVRDEAKLTARLIDDLIVSVVFSGDEDVRNAVCWLIRRAGAALGIVSSSIQSFYDAMGAKKVTGLTVPAINIRGITYVSAQAVFRAALKDNVGALIFEIARSEIDYTKQRPAEYTAAVTAAAIKTGFRGPLFLQGDHFQVSAKKYAGDPAKELNAVKSLISEAIEGGFYNIDIDASTLVDLSKATLGEQQEANSRITAELTALIRSVEPRGITISVGGEIGEVGTKNTTIEEFETFMEQYRRMLAEKDRALKGISKISIQTGTTHGGVPLPDGSIARVKIDFGTLEAISEAARSRFGLSGAVQHGASTLPDEAFDSFPRTGTAEIHLATGFQNIIYDSTYFPRDMKQKIYDYLRTECAGEKKEKDTDEQFIYKTRKKGFGPFKRDLWGLSPNITQAIGMELERQFSFLFDKLNVKNSKALVNKYVKPVDVPLEAPAALRT